MTFTRLGRGDLLAMLAALALLLVMATDWYSTERGERARHDQSLILPQLNRDEDNPKESTRQGEFADTQEKNLRMSLLEEAMTELTDRERHILTERRLKDEPTTLEELAGQYGVSRERVRQIEVRAFEKLQKSMKTQIVERRLAAV